MADTGSALMFIQEKVHAEDLHTCVGWPRAPVVGECASPQTWLAAEVDVIAVCYRLASYPKPRPFPSPGGGGAWPARCTVKFNGGDHGVLKPLLLGAAVDVWIQYMRLKFRQM